MPRNGTPSPWTRVGRARSTRSGSLERVDGGPGRADAGEDDAVDGVDVGRRSSTRRAGEAEVLERVQHARRVARPVVDRPRSCPAQGSERLTVGSRCNRSRSGPEPPIVSVMRPIRAPLRRSRRRSRALLLVPCCCSRSARRLPAATAPAPPPPSDGAPGLGRGPGDGSVAPHRRPARRVLPASAPRPRRTAPPARRCSSSRQMFVTEGNRYNVRGDIAFAQSIVETGVVQLPRLRDGAPVQQQLRRHRRVRLVRQRLPVQQRARRRARRSSSSSATTPTATRAPATIPDPPVPELWGSTPATAAYNFDHYFAKGDAPLWNNMGNGNWATAPELRDRRAAASTTRCSPYSGAARPVPARRPALRCAHRGRSVPGEPAPARPCDRHDAVRAATTC